MRASKCGSKDCKLDWHKPGYWKGTRENMQILISWSQPEVISTLAGLFTYLSFRLYSGGYGLSRLLKALIKGA
jgi:hypothetical protein